LAEQVEAALPGDSALRAMLPEFSSRVLFRTTPLGVRVSRAPVSDTTAWTIIGTTPLDTVRIPDGYHRFRFERAGYRTVSWISGAVPLRAPVVLDSTSSPFPEMVRVPGGQTDAGFADIVERGRVKLADYRIDRYEVTAAEFQRFTDDGGYGKPEFWTEPFVADGRTLSREAAMARLVDRTGRPGPSTWEGGQPAPGTRDLPVSGISWYEAAAYARYKGKSLPTVFHWNRAAPIGMSAQIVPGSNFSSQGARVGSTGAGMSRYGVYDMAGNVREWALNADDAGHRFILGGGWTQPAYIFSQTEVLDPFDRTVINGMRLVLVKDDPAMAMTARPLHRDFRDYASERPANDVEFAAYRRMYDYDPTPLRARVEQRDTTNTAWVREKVSIDAAYGGERLTVYLFLPRQARTPLASVIYFPALPATQTPTAKAIDPEFAEFVLRSGRAVVYPVYKGTFERRDSTMHAAVPDASVLYRDVIVMMGKDLRRSIDYLASRADMDTSRIGYFGFSMGANYGPIMLATEPRIKAAVLVVAGLEMQRMRPEVDPLNFLPRVTTPVVMLNGRYDTTYPINTSQEPFYRLLGSAADRRKRLIYDDNHTVPQVPMISETLAWYDKYLGPVR
jgi:formylglycine-generating enzyme required for sulfatase activity/dienelactone hydrolase